MQLTRSYAGGAQSAAQRNLAAVLPYVNFERPILSPLPVPWLAPIGYAALWVVMLTAVVSAVDYYRRFVLMLNARVTDVNVERERRSA